MKRWYLIPLACLAGIVVGEWGPRERLRALEEAEKSPKVEPARVKSTGFDDFARLANIPAVAEHPYVERAGKQTGKPVGGKRGKGAVKNQKSNLPASTNVVPAVVNTNAVAQRKAEPPKKLSPEDLRARIEEAQQLWGTRVELARATWKEKLKVEGEVAEKFDTVLDEMNEKLYDIMTSLAAVLAQKGEMTPEIGFKFMSDATAVLGETYEAMGAVVAPERRDLVSTLPVTDFVDPGVVEPLVDVQDKLKGFQGFGGAAK